MRFSTASTTPWRVVTPIAVDPSCARTQGAPAVSCRQPKLQLLAHITHVVRTLMASMAYSTWKMRPSGLNVLTPRSYSLRVKNIAAAVSGGGTGCAE
jgi:hypothetical protein